MKKIIKYLSKKIDIIKEKNKNKQIESEGKEEEIVIHKEAQSESEKTNKIEIEISFTTILKIAFTLILVAFIGLIFLELKSIVIMTVISLFLALGISPFLISIERYIPRPFAILLVYFIFLGALFLLFFGILPILAEQLSQIALDLRGYIVNSSASDNTMIASIISHLDLDIDNIKSLLSQNINLLSNNLKTLAGSTLDILVVIFQGIFNLFFTLVLLFFILMERESLVKFFFSLLPGKSKHKIFSKLTRVQEKMTKWFKAQVILMICMGVIIYVGMKSFEFIFGMKYAATIAFLAAFMELFPYIGVFITGLFSLLIALNISLVLSFAIVILIIITQFIEGNILVPLIMEKIVGLSSVTIILAISAGGILGNSLGGIALSILGMILAIPIAASIAIFTDEYLK